MHQKGFQGGQIWKPVARLIKVLTSGKRMAHRSAIDASRHCRPQAAFRVFDHQRLRRLNAKPVKSQKVRFGVRLTVLIVRSLKNKIHMLDNTRRSLGYRVTV